MAQSYPTLPDGFTPAVLRALTMKELLVVSARYGLEAIGQRMEYDPQFIEFLQKIVRAEN